LRIAREESFRLYTKELQICEFIGFSEKAFIADFTPGTTGKGKGQKVNFQKAFGLSAGSNFFLFFGNGSRGNILPHVPQPQRVELFWCNPNNNTMSSYASASHTPYSRLECCTESRACTGIAQHASPS
jgi:hypothetical protein